jgi:DNA end-binding protein Ku
MAGRIWKGSISFGLLNIPVSLEKAEEEHELSFSMLDAKTQSPIKYKKVNSKDGKEVPWDRIVKGYEYKKGQYVLLSKEDLKAANPKATQEIEIEDFVDYADIDLMFLEKPYYIVPQKSGVKGYYLLAQALEKSKKVAIGKIVIRTKMHLAMMMVKDGHLILELLRFRHEVLESKDIGYFSEIKIPKFSPKEIKMAEELIQGMTTKWNPGQYKDTFHDDVMKMIKKKMKGETLEMPEKEDGKVVDLMPLLKKSLLQRKKKAS